MRRSRILDKAQNAPCLDPDLRAPCFSKCSGGWSGSDGVRSCCTKTAPPARMATDFAPCAPAERCVLQIKIHARLRGSTHRHTCLAAGFFSSCSSSSSDSSSSSSSSSSSASASPPCFARSGGVGLILVNACPRSLRGSFLKEAASPQCLLSRRGSGQGVARGAGAPLHWQLKSAFGSHAGGTPFPPAPPLPLRGTFFKEAASPQCLLSRRGNGRRGG